MAYDPVAHQTAKNYAESQKSNQHLLKKGDNVDATSPGSFFFQGPAEMFKYMTTPAGLGYTAIASAKTQHLWLPLPWFSPISHVIAQSSMLKSFAPVDTLRGNVLRGVLGAGIQLGSLGHIEQVAAKGITAITEKGAAKAATGSLHKIIYGAGKSIYKSRRQLAGSTTQTYLQFMAEISKGVNKSQALKGSADKIMTALTAIKDVSKVENALATHVLARGITTAIGVAAGVATAAWVGTRATELVFKKSIDIAGKIATAAEVSRNVDFASKLGDGYRTQGAVTERQRAINFLKRTHVPGTHTFGSEAQEYASIV